MSVELAVVHEWIAARAGSEQVFEAMAGTWPEADLFALTRDPSVPFDSGGREVRTTFLDRPALRDRRGLTLPLMPLAWRALGARRYDWAVTSHHAFASSNRLAEQQLVYAHTPARYIWTPEVDERGRGLAQALARPLLRRIDRAAADRLAGVAANSREVADRIEQYWDRPATVIHPPVDVDYFAAEPDPAEPRLELPDTYLVGLGRWIPYKNHEMIIEIGERAGMPVVLAGHGPLAARLRARAAEATVPVLVVERPGRDAVRQMLRRATALVFPTYEDFGLVPVEAMATGTPVVAAAIGGALETVQEGVSGVLVHEQSVAAYAEAIGSAAALDAEVCRVHARAFDHAAFRRRLTAWTSPYFSSAPAVPAR
jgi:glycosyltransferase involved in cell wall biosynthesis